MRKKGVNNNFSVTDKVIVITGGYGLLGKQFAQSLADEGAKVVITGKDFNKAKKIAHKVNAWACQLDVSIKESVIFAVNNILNEFGVIDGLVNNASFSSPVDGNNNFISFENISERSLEQSIAVDLKGTFLCCQLIGNEMVKNAGGSIINISSIYGTVAPDQRIYKSIQDKNGNSFIKPASYCAVKSAILNLTRYLAVYWANKNIRVNTLTLGGVYDSQSQEFVQSYCERTPLNRMANSDEYNGAIQFLLSNASSYMTGANLVIDGGWTAW